MTCCMESSVDKERRNTCPRKNPEEIRMRWHGVDDNINRCFATEENNLYITRRAMTFSHILQESVWHHRV
jgi:hypothetical protein